MIKLRHIGIVVLDLEASVRFYEEVFNLRVQKTMVEEGSYIEELVGIENASIHWAKLEACDGTVLELLEYNIQDSKVKDNYAANRLGCSHIAMSVENIDEVYGKLIQYGCECKSKPLLSPDGKVKVMYAHDINGTILEVVEEL